MNHTLFHNHTVWRIILLLTYVILAKLSQNQRSQHKVVLPIKNKKSKHVNTKETREITKTWKVTNVKKKCQTVEVSFQYYFKNILRLLFNIIRPSDASKQNAVVPFVAFGCQTQKYSETSKFQNFAKKFIFGDNQSI